ncbi:MAG: hypothetical protein ACE5GK_12595, partial [Nitrospiria bacterium]
LNSDRKSLYFYAKLINSLKTKEVEEVQPKSKSEEEEIDRQEALTTKFAFRGLPLCEKLIHFDK